jgi:hypothetical protein
MAIEKLPSKPSGTEYVYKVDQDDAVNLHVGPSKHAIIAHGGFISRNYEFLKAVLKKEWSESQTQIVKLPNNCRSAVTNYLRYTYCKRILTNTLDENCTDILIIMFKKEYETLAELYVLGERLFDHCVRVAVVREIIRLIRSKDKDMESCIPTKEAVNIIYCGTTAGSPARRLMVDIRLVHGVTEVLTQPARLTSCLTSYKACTPEWQALSRSLKYAATVACARATMHRRSLGATA